MILFMGGGGEVGYGLVGKYLRWERPELMGEVSRIERCVQDVLLFRVEGESLICKYYFSARRRRTRSHSTYSNDDL